MAYGFSALSNLPGSFSPDTMLLMTDGSVLVHDAYGKNWYRLTPDANGKYDSGSWSGALPMTNSRQFFASGILKDGRVFAVGGEYSDDLSLDRPDGSNGSGYNGVAGGFCTKGEIFDPVTNVWSPLNKPVSFNWILGDATGCVLADGRVIIGSALSSRSAIWDPTLDPADAWTEAGLAFGAAGGTTKAGNTDEETWSLLPDGSVMTVRVAGIPGTEKYIPATDQWVADANTKSTLTLASLVDPSSGSAVGISEIGPAIFLPDGRLFAVGGTGHTGLYTPPTTGGPASNGVWTTGPDFPPDTSANNFNAVNGSIQTAIDTPAVLLPNGKVLVVGGQTVREVDSKGNVSFWSNPCNVFIFDPVAPPIGTGTITLFGFQPPSNSVDAWQARLLLLPNGQVLFSSQQSAMSILTVDPALGAPSAAWQPVISTAPSSMVTGHTYIITGTQFNGISQACSYGDDATIATNYPIVQLTNTANNKVVYLRSFNFSSLGIATGNTPQTISVQVPAKTDPGQYNLVVIANGIASNSVIVQIVSQDLFFIVDRSTYGQGEIQALINLNGAPAIIDPAMYLVVEGFKPGDLGITAANLGNPPVQPTIAPPTAGITFQFSGPVIPEDPTLPNSPQRFTFPFRIIFQDATTMFNFVNSIEDLTLTGTLTQGAVTVSNNAQIQLTKNPNPFILHGDAANQYQWILSTDVRVFQMKAGQTKFAAHVATTGAARSVATGFIQQAINNLNGSPGSAGALFDAIPENEQAASLALAPTDTNGVPVYNFAVARIRYQDIVPANTVRAFFRMWPAQQTNASYDTTTLYRSTPVVANNKIPLLGIEGDEIMTIPFFATPRIDTTSASMATQTDTFNVRPVITPDALGGEVDTYFGCWLDINQPGEQIFPVRMVGGTPVNIPDGPFTGMGTLYSIQQLVRSEHQCLLTEVSFDLDPIPTNADPSNSDKLAQRNLTFVNVPNPGLINSRSAPQTFEIRPTPYFFPADLKPDEMMIDWGNTPAGSMASIYLPEASADNILKQSGELYSTHRLTKLDDHTIQCVTGGVTYIPIPRKLGPNFAGLLTVDLPAGIKKGEQYQITVKQVTTAISGGRVQEVQQQQVATVGNVAGAIKPATSQIVIAAKGGKITRQWRRVLGVFRLLIPVSTKHALLASEERRLSVFRWIQKSIPVGDRWYLVFQRYVEQLGLRVGDMGGIPDNVLPDPNGDWSHKGFGRHGKDGDHEGDKERSGEEKRLFSGKIAGLIYDHWGNFEGFYLEMEEGERKFESREAEMEELVHRAWTERIFCSVVVEQDNLYRPLRVVLRRGVH